jgi:hypothetical protein
MGWREQTTDFGKTEEKYFSRGDWTGQISLNRLAKFDSTRMQFGGYRRRRKRWRTRIYPSGRISRSVCHRYHRREQVMIVKIETERVRANAARTTGQCPSRYLQPNGMGCGLLYVHLTPIATKLCVSAKFRHVPLPEIKPCLRRPVILRSILSIRASQPQGHPGRKERVENAF